MLLNRVHKLAGWVLGLALVLGSAPAWAQTGGLEGRCMSEKGEPLVGYTVLIERQDVKGHYKTKTNKKGDYMHIGLPIGNYKVTLQSPSGQTVFYFQSHVGLGDNTVLNFDLAKEKKIAAEEREKKIEADPELKKRMEEEAKDQKEYTGLKGLFDQSMVLMNAGKYAEAVPLLEQALPLAKGKNVGVIQGRLAEAYHKAKMYDKAIDAYQKAIADSPTEAGLYNNLGNCYAAMGKNDLAAAQFQKAAEVDPTRAASYYFNYGAIMYNLGKMDEAVAAFQKSVQVDPTYAESQYMLGRSLMAKLQMDPETGKVIAAPGTVEALEEYMKLEPQGTHVAEVQSMLQSIQGTVSTSYTKKKGKK
jgi:tetratricopeptide (TPR) repeat protein